MEVKIVLYGIARDIIGSNNHNMVFENKMSVGNVLDQLKAEFPELTKLKSLLVAVNDEYADNEYLLTDQDEVVLIPPVSGG